MDRAMTADRSEDRSPDEIRTLVHALYLGLFDAQYELGQASIAAVNGARARSNDVQTGAETLGHRARDHDRAYGIVGGGAFERGNTPCTIARSSAFTGGRASVMRAAVRAAAA